MLVLDLIIVYLRLK